MKSSKILTGAMFTFMLLFFMSMNQLFAQTGGGKGGFMNASPDERAKRLTQMMKDELKLTPAQETKVSAINLKYAKKNEELRKADKAEAQKKMEESNKARESEFKTILTPEQYKQYLKLEEEMKARRKEMRR